MDQPTPSTTSRKRKRTPSSTSTSRNASASAPTPATRVKKTSSGSGKGKDKDKGNSSNKVINPLSHPPNTVKQFRAAGLSLDAPLPSRIFPGFPHQAIPPRPPPPRRDSRRPGSGDPGAARGWGWEHHFYSGEEIEVDIDTDADGAGYESGVSSQVDDGGEQTGNSDDDERVRKFPSVPPGDVRAGSTTTGGEEEELSRHRERYNNKKKPHAAVTRREPGAAAAERAAAHKKHLGGLLQIIDRGLMEGNIGTAKRAFGLLMRSRVYGTAVDLRYADYWKLGLEILLREGQEEEERRRKRRLMRKKRLAGEGVDEEQEGFEDFEEEQEDDGYDGEEEDEDEDEEEVEYKFARKRAADVLGKVKAYYETLIKLHPYNRTRPTALSSLHFYPAMFRFEVDDVRTEYDQGRQRLERIRRLGGSGEEGDEEEEGDERDYEFDHSQEQRQYGDDSMEVDAYDENDQDQDHSSSRRGRRSSKSTATTKGGIIDHPADKLRQKALTRLTDIAHRMDQNVLPNLPYSKDYVLLSLRAEIALLMADLSVPCLLPLETITTPGSGSGSGTGEIEIKYEFEKEERERVEEGKRAREKERIAAFKMLKKMKKTIRRGGLLEKEDELILETLKQELRGGKYEVKERRYDIAEADSEEDGEKEEGDDGDDEAGDYDDDDMNQNQRRKQKEKQKKMDEKKAKRKEARRASVSVGDSQTSSGRGMFSSLPIR